VQLFLQHQSLLDDEDLFEDGHDHDVPLVPDRHRPVDGAIDGDALDLDLFA
jgi:hypothetical protein